MKVKFGFHPNLTTRLPLPQVKEEPTISHKLWLKIGSSCLNSLPPKSTVILFIHLLPYSTYVHILPILKTAEIFDYQIPAVQGSESQYTTLTTQYPLPTLNYHHHLLIPYHLCPLWFYNQISTFFLRTNK